MNSEEEEPDFAKDEELVLTGGGRAERRRVAPRREKSKLVDPEMRNGEGYSKIKDISIFAALGVDFNGYKSILGC